ncbi:pyridoxal phosphate-dependent aminotransferase [Geobacter sulfurreducens]|uniref:alanine transaminase n=1 Tax=Geobacter sulfurreducens (strain ATCC 51573 / DSM 12127 / PCA) TaxID=243231 RepID=Q74GX7_GEOSL|nr:pyridoxal phosphate-dependent aminotransferase [Geobacter sulfurreducens]AAR33452.1 amino acid aminotransferase, putative [Geobacter sulfurreducens PCA]ADI82955.1 amino acid aminotransferase, putative [Geobacter sulfurreducens KN400]AJY69854.1 aminotransferase [Geobacter sulfurreducens]QVW35396.1 pyridoxal phosphate-dependent aminotransferase [Geobacter sulfurreducens]UAC04219.1 pyridoxal phosphate-dependent aminotransferase [Geobacter sulfurreducens]
MRNELVTPGAGELTYEIRNIVNVAEKLQKHGVKINWENIGDPIVKKEEIPRWMKEIVAAAVMENDTWGYCHTRGVLETREFLCGLTNNRGGAQITPDDIIFFNGLGDAISTVYGNLRHESRILMPSPTYTTHSIGEAAHAQAAPVCYRLKPEDNWFPDVEDLENHVKYNPQISGILLINPDNPTGMVYPREILEQIVAIARRYDLFIIADEVYNNITYNGQTTVPISDVIGEVPAIAMKGISKEIPWPGSRCGWIEVYNGNRDEQFHKFLNSILTAKMNEVCSTTLPQKCIPAIMKHPEYQTYLRERIACYERMSTITYDCLKQVPGLMVNRTNGAFYMSVAFRDGLLTDRQSLPIESVEVRELVEKLVNAPGVSPDKRFVYYILASTGICIVPLSSFNTPLQGFRVTLLEKDENECMRIYRTLAERIKEYLNS